LAIRPTSSIYDVAVIEILFKRPAGPMIRSIEDFIKVSMDDLDFLSQDSQEEREPTVIEYVEDRPLDWDRLRDCNDSYASILVDTNR
jgi:hypothetical protein